MDWLSEGECQDESSVTVGSEGMTSYCLVSGNCLKAVFEHFI